MVHGNLLLFGVTSAELAVLVILTPTFTITDWIYVLQHLTVLVIALTRRPASVQDRSLMKTGSAVAVSYMYPYAQVIYLGWMPGVTLWPEAGFILVAFATGLSSMSIVTLGRCFGVRPALRGLKTKGPYGLVRHPIYLSYMIADIGYNLQEWNVGTALFMLAGWMSLIYRIHAEEQILSLDPGWKKYAVSVPCRLLPGVW